MKKNINQALVSENIIFVPTREIAIADSEKYPKRV